MYGDGNFFILIYLRKLFVLLDAILAILVSTNNITVKVSMGN